MSLTDHYIDKMTNIQHQLLPLLQILDNNNETKFKQYILNKNMESLSNIMHNIDNIMLEIVKLKFACQSFCDINNRSDLLSKINLDKTLSENQGIEEKLQNDKENQEVINKFIPIMMYYSMMKDFKNKSNSNQFGPTPKVDLTQESEQYD